MGLLKCPDCGKEFSDRIDACPNCFCPKSAILEELEAQKKQAEKEIEIKDTTPETVVEQSTESPVLPVEEPVTQSTEVNYTESNTGNYPKADLMSSQELKEFAIKSILPYICEELKIANSQIRKCDEQYGVDFIAKTSSETIGIKFVIDIAPNKTQKLYDEEAAKKMHSMGFKFAVAPVGIGARDAVRFNRRIVLQNDAYYFNYIELKYFEYKDLSNVRFSLSADDSWEYIFEPVRQSSNPYIIQKPKKSYREQFYEEQYNTVMPSLLEKYSIRQEHREFLEKYILSLATSIQYSLSVEYTLVTFLNCVDYCKGWLLSDSKAIAEDKIIVETIKMLEDNSLISLDKYELFNFAFYVYYFLKNGEFNSEVISSYTANKMKTDLFNLIPELFGYPKAERNTTPPVHTVNNSIPKKASANTNPNPIQNSPKEPPKKIPEDFEDYYELNSSKSLRVLKTILGVLLLISAFISLPALSIGGILVLIEIIFLAVLGILILCSPNWIFPLIITIYQGISMVLGIAYYGYAPGLLIFIFAIIVTIKLANLNIDFKNYAQNRNTTDTVHCRICGSTIPKGKSYCTECGTKIINSSSKKM